MPRCNGIEATRRIRTMEAEQASARLGRWTAPPAFIIGLTAAADGEKDCMAAGMDAFLTKPLDPRGLREVLLRRFAQACPGDPAEAAAARGHVGGDDAAATQGGQLRRIKSVSSPR